MFADNDRISLIQLERQFALAYLGPMVLWISSGFSGREGILSIICGTFLLGLWIFFMMRQVHVYRYPEKYWGHFMSRIVILIYQFYLILTGGWLIGQLGNMLTEYFVQGIPVWAVSGLLVLTALGGSQNIQARGRFAQAAWPLVGILTGGMFLLAAFQGEPEVFLVQSDSQQPWRMEDTRQMIQQTAWFLAAFTGAGLLPFLLVQVDTSGGHTGSMFRMIGKAGLWQGAILLILLGSFGEKGAEALEYPVLDLMAGVTLPGGFIRRIDLIFLTVLLFALIFSLSSVFFYSKYIWERVDLPWGRTPVVVLSFLLGTMEGGQWSLIREYPRLLLWIVLPLFLVISVCNSFLKKGKFFRR